MPSPAKFLLVLGLLGALAVSAGAVSTPHVVFSRSCAECDVGAYCEFNHPDAPANVPLACVTHGSVRSLYRRYAGPGSVCSTVADCGSTPDIACEGDWVNSRTDVAATYDISTSKICNNGSPIYTTTFPATGTVITNTMRNTCLSVCGTAAGTVFPALTQITLMGTTLTCNCLQTCSTVNTGGYSAVQLWSVTGICYMDD